MMVHKLLQKQKRFEIYAKENKEIWKEKKIKEKRVKERFGQKGKVERLRGI